MSCTDRNFWWPKIRSTTIILDGPRLCSTTILLNSPKLRLTRVPLGHRPKGRFKITYHIWSIGQSSIWTVKICKFGRSKFCHLNQGAFLVFLLCNTVSGSLTAISVLWLLSSHDYIAVSHSEYPPLKSLLFLKGPVQVPQQGQKQILDKKSESKWHSPLPLAS